MQKMDKIKKIYAGEKTPAHLRINQFRAASNQYEKALSLWWLKKRKGDNTMKKTVVILLTLILMMTNLGTVLADTVSAPPVSQISSTPGYASIEKRFSVLHDSETKGAPSIIFIKSSISKKSSTSVTVAATTETSSSVTRIGGYLNIQRWNNNTWSSYKTTSFWSYGTNRATTTKTINVASGYYYRLMTTHVAINGEGTKQIVSTTSSVFVN